MKNGKHTLTSLALTLPLLLAVGSSAQNNTPPPALQEKLHALQQASARNEEKLRTYQWLETVTVTIDGNLKPPKQSICRYTLDGVIEKIPVSPQQQMPPRVGGPLRQHIMERKIKEVQEAAQEVRGLTDMYLPMKPGPLKDAIQTRRVDLEHDGTGRTAVVIHDYVKPGDQLRLELDPATMQLVRIRVQTYFADPKAELNASVDFSKLEDGTTYPALTTVNAPSKKLSITTTSSNFTRALW